MTSGFWWKDQRVPFTVGETFASALERAGIVDFGSIGAGVRGRYFCGIGACQGCLVVVNNHALVEACLTIAQDNAHLDSAFPEAAKVSS
jgi:hypothetical protein